LDISKEQAVQAIELCLQNTTGFLEDARVLFSAKKLQRIWMAYENALEELGKTKEMLGQLEQGKNPIQMNNEIRTRHQKQLDAIKNDIGIPEDRVNEYERIWAEFPMPHIQLNAKHYAEQFKELDKAIVEDLADKGHQRRKDCRVNFKANGDPYMVPPMREGDCKLMEEVIEGKIIEFQKRLDNLR
jgi:hypothetical protein